MDGNGDEEAEQDPERLSRIGLGLTSLTALPELASAADLRSLCLHGNQLTSLSGLHRLSSLTELNASSNALLAVGDALCALTNLRCVTEWTIPRVCIHWTKLVRLN